MSGYLVIGLAHRAVIQSSAWAIIICAGICGPLWGKRRGKASIRISAETQDAARLLSGARGQLGQMLENAGMRLASFQAIDATLDAFEDLFLAAAVAQATHLRDC